MMHDNQSVLRITSSKDVSYNAAFDALEELENLIKQPSAVVKNTMLSLDINISKRTLNNNIERSQSVSHQMAQQFLSFCEKQKSNFLADNPNIAAKIKQSHATAKQEEKNAHDPITQHMYALSALEMIEKAGKGESIGGVEKRKNELQDMYEVGNYDSLKRVGDRCVAILVKLPGANDQQIKTQVKILTAEKIEAKKAEDEAQMQASAATQAGKKSNSFLKEIGSKARQPGEQGTELLKPKTTPGMTRR